jgi:hypothetical protein
LDGKWHIEGRLQCAERSDVKQLFGSVAGLLRAAGESEKIIVSPLVRYCAKPCCLDPGHVTNLGSPDYANFLCEQLSAVNDWLKDMAFFKRIRNFKVICPNKLLNANKSVEAAAANLAKFWAADPVHMTEAGYSALAGAIYNFVARGREAGAAGVGPGTSSSTGTGTGTLMKKIVKPVRRESWVATDEAVAVRDDGPRWRGGSTRGVSFRGRPFRGKWPVRGKSMRGRGQRGRGAFSGWRGKPKNNPY